MDDSSQSSAPIKLIIRLLLTILLVYVMSTFLDRIFFLTGGLPAYIVVGSLVTLMNVIVRPILHVITLPLKLFATIIALIIVNGVFLWLIEKIADNFDPTLLTLRIDQGMGGWILVAVIFGLSNWVMKEILK